MKTEIQKLSPKKGDILLVRVPDAMSSGDRARIAEEIGEFLPAGIVGYVVPASLTVENVVRDVWDRHLTKIKAEKR